tara:strand:+ start:63 stop:347 length:285 start_codon:yes stop_codon:yes gene_type:complete
MKDTNAIVEALKSKSKKELEQVVNVFMNELEIKIRGEYNSTNYYEFIPPNGNKKFSVMGTEQIKNVLLRMLINAHLDSMLEVKSKELISKLELV